MNQVMIDIWPYLMIPIAGAIGWLFREVFILKSKSEVLGAEIKGLESDIKDMKDRLNSHSKKQDAILERIGNMEKEVLGKMGDITVSMTSLAGDLKSLTNLIAISDAGIKIKREQ